MTKRIIGIDVARALAIIGMIIVNFKMVLGHEGDSWMQSFSNIFDGKAAATFVVLAGIGLAFMTNSSIKNNDELKLKKSKKSILKRALFLFTVGLSYIYIWPADILHFYGIYMLLTLLFIKSRPKIILLFSVFLIFIYPILMFFFNYDTNWNFTTYTYQDFWTLKGFFRNLFYNGFHPVIPWASFMLIGLWFGKQDLNNDKFIKRSLWVSLSIFILVRLTSALSIYFLSEGNESIANELLQVLGTSPMPPLPVYMLSGSSIAIFIISICILISRKFNNNSIIIALTKTGQLALTFYVAHVIIGMGSMEIFSATELGMYSLNFSIVYAFIFSLLCIIFAVIWTKYKKLGPLEWVMRKLTS
ncbi:DUF418 domain-containing protein [Flavivirga spongiicola]|uniref:Heparan-alpha-glucosaminide N-acetyltransferase domain-containing protein n=1 Tax=Flavivirga spongiicola TaxID=421621 RepID=A0ABU7XPX2_9FLAO|nr:heparan-alpha-glucosaminide N-acetyltransferase domain-containing protein [Flavivirga sp. MEBiC05379]MDO5981618.1 heparan-alpha-glucosaminide N-acetyltransferase domain-containing protein [Flavivirga sp. MEBiC05379]